jgi:hypothetical protein
MADLLRIGKMYLEHIAANGRFVKDLGIGLAQVVEVNLAWGSLEELAETDVFLVYQNITNKIREFRKSYEHLSK